MDHSNGLHGIIITLLTISHLELWSCQELIESLTPIDVELHPDLKHQRLAVKWNINNGAFSSSLYITFHIQVARSRNMIIILEKYYNSSLSEHGKLFSWVWESELPLECDSHSVRIRGGSPSGEYWSTWSDWKTHDGNKTESEKDIMIYPHEKVVLEGSDVNFCCLPPSDYTIKKMTYKKIQYPNQSILMNTQSFVIMVKNVSRTLSDGDNAKCFFNNTKLYGTVLTVSRPPNEPKDFSCITQDFYSLHCSWNPGPIYNFDGPLKETYILNERVSGKWSSCSRHNCTWLIAENQQIYNFTLNVSNPLGEKSIHAAVNLQERVQPVSPTKLTASNVNATYAVLLWTLAKDYTSIVLHCQTDLQRSTVNATFNGKTQRERYSMHLTQLQPFTKYELRVRCMADSSLAGWSNWSNAFVILTHEDAPSAPVDVWREIRDNNKSRLLTLYWKPLPDLNANGNILHFNITWWSLGSHMMTNTIIVPANHTQHQISIGSQAHIISVTAENGAGVSPAAKIKIPGAGEGGDEEVDTQPTSGRDGEIRVSWRPVHAVDGYVVEWCSSPRSPHCDLQWKKYNSSTHTDVIKSDAFQHGVRYDFRIYGSKENGEYLLGILTGYTKELASSEKPKVKIAKIDGVSLTLDWSPYPTGNSQEGFVSGYVIYVKPTEGNCQLKTAKNHTVLDGIEMCKFCIEDPNTMTTTIRGLKPSTEYEVAVVAVTGGGETTKEFIQASTLPDTGAAILSILLPVVIVSVLAVVLLIAGCWKSAWLKEACYPDIPDPNKSKVLSVILPKGSAKASVTPTVSSSSQKVELVHILEKEKDISNELKENSSRQPGVIYSTIQRPDNTNCSQSSADMYITTSTEHGSPCDQTPETPHYKLQSPTYLEFFNQNYNSVPDDTFERFLIPGYQPQVDTALLPESSGGDAEVPICSQYTQYKDLTSGADLTFKTFENLSVCETEPMSPTSVTSTSFILAV